MMERIRRADSRGLDSDSRIVPTCDSNHDFIRTPIGASKDFLETFQVYIEMDPAT